MFVTSVSDGGISLSVDVNDCAAQPCKNGGTCRDLEGDFKCHCPSPYVGKQCQLRKCHQSKLHVANYSHLNHCRLVSEHIDKELTLNRYRLCCVLIEQQ